MGLGVRPVTPGTVVVLAASILLILVTVSTPLIKSIYFLDATVSADSISETIKLGVFGYCASGAGNACSNVTVGYDLNVDALFGVSGLAAATNIPNSLIKWLTYVLILHPIAAGFAVLATLCGALAHIREFDISGFATCFASIGGTIAIIAFAFDIALFIIAKKRIESSSVGGSATLGNALWMTLAGALLLIFSGCFFGVGRCIIRKRKPEKEASERNKPQPDIGYGQALRQEALTYKNNYGQSPMYQNGNGGNNTLMGGKGHGRGEGSLPEFAERDGEIIPLTALQQHDLDDDFDSSDPHDGQPYRDGGSRVSGVGVGYGRRNDGPVPLGRAASETGSGATTPGRAGFGAGRAAAAGGAGAYLASQARADRGHEASPSTVVPFQGMQDTPSSTPPRQGSYGATSPIRQSAAYGPTSPTRQGGFSGPLSDGGHHDQALYAQGGPSTSQYGYGGAPSGSQYPQPAPDAESSQYHSVENYAQPSYNTSAPMSTPPYGTGFAAAAASGYPNDKAQSRSPPPAPVPQHSYSSGDFYHQQQAPLPAPVPQRSQQQFYTQNPSELHSEPTGSTYPSYAAPSYYTHAPESQQGHYDGAATTTQQQRGYSGSSYGAFPQSSTSPPPPPAVPQPTSYGGRLQQQAGPLHNPYDDEPANRRY